MQKLKMFTIMSLSLLMLSACGEKDAQYFYDKPEEAKKVSTECNAKLSADTLPLSTLTQLRDDVQCQNATLAVMGIQMGDLKKAQLINEEEGWKSLVSSLIEMTEGAAKARDELKVIAAKPFAEAIVELDKANDRVLCSDGTIERYPFPSMQKLVKDACNEAGNVRYQLLSERFGKLADMSIQEKVALSNDLDLTQKSCSFSIFDEPEQRLLDLCKSISLAKEEVENAHKIQSKRDELSKINSNNSFRGNLNILKEAYPTSCTGALEMELCRDIDARYEELVKQEFSGFEAKTYEERLAKQGDIRFVLFNYCFRGNLSEGARATCANLEKINTEINDEMVKRSNEETLRKFRN